MEKRLTCSTILQSSRGDVEGGDRFVGQGRTGVLPPMLGVNVDLCCRKMEGLLCKGISLERILWVVDFHRRAQAGCRRDRDQLRILVVAARRARKAGVVHRKVRVVLWNNCQQWARQRIGDPVVVIAARAHELFRFGLSQPQGTAA